MSYDLQRADIWKRGSAFLLDFILTVIVASGFIFLLALVTNVNKQFEIYESRMEHFESEYGIDLEKIQNREEYEALPEDQRALVDAAWKAFSTDEEALRSYNLAIQLSIINVSIGILFAFLITEFAVPMFLKNGQTVGKKVFGVAIMRTDGVKVNGQIMFIRSILGKYTIETMVPLMMLVWLVTGQAGIMAPVIILLIIVSNLVMMMITRTNSGIHDMLANTVTVDMSSQLIFDSPEALLEYKQKIHAEAVERAEYR